MFDLGWSELLVIAVVAILVIGPKDLPVALRAFGRWSGKMRRMAGDFQRQFNEAVREAELDDVKKTVRDIGRIDPVADLRKDMKKVEAGLRSELDKQAARSAAKAAPSAAAPPEAPSPTGDAAAPAADGAAPPAPVPADTAKT